LTLAHEQLSQLVAPATPRTLMYLRSQRRDGFLAFLGPVRMISSIVGFALAFLSAFIFLSILFDIHPSIRLIFHLQLLAAAGIGGSFSALFEASRYIVNSTFDPRYKGYYWVKIVLGLTAGYIVAELLQTAVKGPENLGPPTLALLGGFSGSVVYNILKRLSDGMEAMVMGDPKAVVSAQQASARSRATEEVNRSKLTQTTGLMQIQNMIAAGANPEDLQKRVMQLLSDSGVGVLDGSSGAVKTNNGPQGIGPPASGSEQSKQQPGRAHPAVTPSAGTPPAERENAAAD
ncbi:MAG: hypothetical protein ACREAC_08445, partial [Blastocatellia bacterium]